MGKRRQQYHLEPDRGLLNDPNGLSYYNGRYYVFFQWNRFAKDHSHKEWGLFTSSDLLNWRLEGSALLPDQTYDSCGVYSGSAYVIEDKLYLFYTGNVKKDGERRSRQCIAVTEDGRTFLKLGCAVETPDEYTEHFRDPKVLKTRENGYYMVIGAQRLCGKGALAFCHSSDGRNWEYRGMPAVSEDYEMIECPDLFKLDGRYLLIYNPQSRDNGKDIPLMSFTAVKFIEFDEQSGTFSDSDLDHGFSRMDYGLDFYAPQTFTDDQGRRILYAWMSRMDEKEETAFAEGEPNIHCLTLPRELKIIDGKLYQMPVSELDKLKTTCPAVARTGKSTAVIRPEQRTYCIHISHIDSYRALSMWFNEGEASLEWLVGESVLRFGRRSWVTGQTEFRECSVQEFREAEIWCDCSSIEIFINNGEKVISSRIEPEAEYPSVVIEGLNGTEEILAHDITPVSDKTGPAETLL